MTNVPTRPPLLLVLAAVTLAALSACSPPMSTDAPEIEGQVVDGVTGLPVISAVVSMTYGGEYQQVGSDMIGSFYLPAMQIVNVPLVTPKNLHNGGTLKIEAPGYRTYTESGLGACHAARSVGREAPGTVAGGRTGPDFDHVRIALIPNA